MRIAKVSVTCIAICGTLGVPGVALAQDPGIHFDSGSPAGKEYAIPLAEGRAEGAGTKNQRAAADVPHRGHRAGRAGSRSRAGAPALVAPPAACRLIPLWRAPMKLKPPDPYGISFLQLA